MRSRYILILTTMAQIHRLWTPADKDWLRQHYPDTPTDECAAYLGRTVWATQKVARQTGVRKSPRYMATVRYGAEVCARIAQTRKALIAADRRRWKNDLPQRTRIHFSNQSDAKMSWRSAMRKAGYLEFADDKNRMYYPDGLERHPKLEASAKRHNVVVLPMSERNSI